MAEEYNPNVSEYINITLSGVTGDASSTLSVDDFVWHYYTGGGKEVALREFGLLRAVVDEYLNQARGDLVKAIAKEARENTESGFQGRHRDSYYMGGVVSGVAFSLGNSTFIANFSGRSKLSKGVLSLSGDIDFIFFDEFKDPLDLRELLLKPGTLRERFFRAGILRDILDNVSEPGGTPYPIRDEWHGTFYGEIYADPSASKF